MSLATRRTHIRLRRRAAAAGIFSIRSNSSSSSATSASSSRWTRLFPSATSQSNNHSPVRAAWLMLDSTASFRGSARGFDAGVVDLQHGLRTVPSTSDFAAIIDTGAVPMARVAGNEAHCVSQALDAGARGLICPMINTPAEAAKLVAHARFPPLGGRSFGPSFGLPGAPDGPDAANAGIVVLGMIETQEALDNVEGIVATEGLDGLFIGPMDLGLRLGVGASALRLEGALAEAAAHVRRTAHAAGKHVGIYGGSAAYARDRAEEGFDLVVPFTDWACLVGGAQEAVGAFGGGGGGENEGGGYGGR